MIRGVRFEGRNHDIPLSNHVYWIWMASDCQFCWTGYDSTIPCLITRAEVYHS